jgi:hypothetical protein
MFCGDDKYVQHAQQSIIDISKNKIETPVKPCIKASKKAVPVSVSTMMKQRTYSVLYYARDVGTAGSTIYNTFFLW